MSYFSRRFNRRKFRKMHRRIRRIKLRRGGFRL